jgi:hypothetical protein
LQIGLNILQYGQQELHLPQSISEENSEYEDDDEGREDRCQSPQRHFEGNDCGSSAGSSLSFQLSLDDEADEKHDEGLNDTLNHHLSIPDKMLSTSSHTHCLNREDADEHVWDVILMEEGKE